MNAICGVLHRQAGAALVPMLAKLDALGSSGDSWRDADIALGVRRRAEPADAEAELRVDAAAQIAVVANCRLDNRAELCDAIGLRATERQAHTNADLLLLAWRRWGEACPAQLLGDYAFAVWDAKRRALFCARDPVGIKPLYYALTATSFAFASTVEAVVAAPSVDSQLDDATVAAWLTRVSFVSPTHTFFKAVRKLPAGHCLTATQGNPPAVKLRRHWCPEQTASYTDGARRSDADYAEELRHLSRQAVQARLPTAGRVGTHLSGGLDSSSVTVYAARELAAQGRPPPLAFSWLPAVAAQPRELEYRLVQAVCDQERLQVSHQSPSAEDILATLRQDAALPGAHVHLNEDVTQRAAAAQGVTLLLSGWGGDEGVSFNGRGGNAQLLLHGRWQELLANRGGNEPALKFLATVLLRLAHPELAEVLRLSLRRTGPRRRWLIDPAFARRTKPLPQPAPRLVGMRQTQLRLLQSGELAERMEGWAASGSAHGIEYRYPLLDRRLLEFALRLPPELFRHQGHQRPLMRRAAAPLLPREVGQHIDKADPVRFTAVREAFAAALPLAHQRLERRTEPPARAHYIDMPNLMQRLRQLPFRVWTHLPPLRVALQFLDF